MIVFFRSEYKRVICQVHANEENHMSAEFIKYSKDTHTHTHGISHSLAVQRPPCVSIRIVNQTVRTAENERQRNGQKITQSRRVSARLPRYTR